MASQLFVPAVGTEIQDLIGHWYRVIEVQAAGYRFKVDQIYVTHNSETGGMQFRSYGYRPIVMGRSEFQLGGGN